MMKFKGLTYKELCKEYTEYVLQLFKDGRAEDPKNMQAIVAANCILPEVFDQEFLEDGTIMNIQPSSSKTFRLPTLYKFGTEFAEHLVQADISILPISQLPTTFHACFEILGKWMFVNMFRGEKVKTSDGRIGEGFLACTCFFNNNEESFFCCPVGKDFQTVDDILSAIGDPMTEEEKQVLVRHAVNALVYVSTGAPDLRDYKPPSKFDPLPRKEKDKLVQQYGTDECVLVSWDWKKPRSYHTTGWEVSGHFWWAPVGPGRLARELRWREGHMRTRV